MRKINMLTIAAGLITLMSCLPCMAQALKVTFTTPFSFYAGGAKLPPGTYTLRPQQEDPSVFEIQDAQGTHSALVEARPSTKTTNGSPQVVFNRYATGDYLEGVLTSTGDSVDFETGVAEKIAAKKGSPQSHTVSGK
jgi:hypothetical protein